MSRALLQAAEKGDLSKVQQLLAQGVDVDFIHKPTGRTPLIQAAISGHCDVAKALIQAGANVNHQDTAVEFTALMWACCEGHLPLVELLISAQADVNSRDPEFGWTPLLVAAQAGSQAIVQKLLDAGADLHASTTDGRTAVAVARTDKKLDVAAMLERLGCSAECTVAPPARLPWPAMDRKAENIDFQNPDSVVRGLIISMNHFENMAHLKSSGEKALALLSDVYARFCTKKERPYGRRGSYQWPPEYDPGEEYLIETKIVTPRRAEVVTRNDDSETEYLYVLLKQGGKWLVDSKKYRLIGGKWSTWAI